MEQQRSESDYFVPTSKITVFIDKITKMSKNANVESELSQVLDDFLEKLGECDRYLENGIFNMNFAEAALLLQSSADLYSKKVDLLWDIIFDYQKRLLLSEEHNGDKNQEIEKVEERKRKYKRKRKANSDESQTANLVNNFSFGNVENVDYLNEDYEAVDLSKEWSKFQAKDVDDSLQGHISNKNFIFLPNNSVYSEDNDYIGRYDQFHSMSLIDEIFHLQEQKLLVDECNCVIKMRIDSYVVNDFLLEKSIPSTKSIDSYSADLKEYIKDFFESHKNAEKEVTPSSALELCKKNYLSMDKQSFKLMTDNLRRSSLADSLFDDDHIGPLSEHCPSPCNSIEHEDPKNCEINESFEQISKSLEVNRSKSCSQDSAFYEDEEHAHEDCEPETDIPDVTPESVTATEDVTGNIPAQNAETTNEASVEEIDTNAENTASAVEEISDANASVRNAASEIDGAALTEDVTPNLASSMVAKKLKSTKNAKSPITNPQPCTGGSVVVTRPKVMKRWSSLLEEPKDEEQKVENKRRKVQVAKRISEKALKKLATGVTVKYRDFEMFCRMQYKAAEGEGIVPAQLSDSDESGEEDNHITDEDENDPTPLNSEVEMSDLEDKNQEEEEEDENNPEHSISNEEETPSSVPPELPDPNISPIPNPHLAARTSPEDRGDLGMTSTPHRPRNSALDLDLEQEDGYRKNVREWRSFIIPKLKTLQNRADFDIHEYGSRIIEPSEIGEERRFKDIVEGKNAAEVARYFIATLQLANTYNVEITGASPGEVANDSFQVKTLDKTKHHELLEEYQAPSEETFRERLQRVKAVSASSHSYRGPPVKKIKFSDWSRRSLS